MTYALLKTENRIVRIVSEHSLKQLYGIMEDYDAPYDVNLVKHIKQSDIKEIDSNLLYLQYCLGDNNG